MKPLYFHARIGGLLAMVAAAAIVLAGIALAVIIFPPHHEAIGRAGEWITRDSDNSKVCRLTRDVRSGFEFGPGDCADWTEAVPVHGQWIAGSPAQRWVGCVPGHCRLHFADGWRE
jgi:hypothetical protein